MGVSSAQQGRGVSTKSLIVAKLFGQRLAGVQATWRRLYCSSYTLSGRKNNSISQTLMCHGGPAVIAKQLVNLARKHIEEQQSRIARQRELIAKYERDNDAARLSGARIVLERMQKQLTQMTAAHVAAEEHLSKLTVDEASVEKVVRDTPM